jgi:hypothetical protein
LIQGLQLNDRGTYENYGLTLLHRGAPDLKQYHDAVSQRIENSRIPGSLMALQPFEDAIVILLVDCINSSEIQLIEPMMADMGYSNYHSLVREFSKVPTNADVRRAMSILDLIKENKDQKLMIESLSKQINRQEVVENESLETTKEDNEAVVVEETKVDSESLESVAEATIPENSAFKVTSPFAEETATVEEIVAVANEDESSVVDETPVSVVLDAVLVDAPTPSKPQVFSFVGIQSATSSSMNSPGIHCLFLTQEVDSSVVEASFVFEKSAEAGETAVADVYTPAELPYLPAFGDDKSATSSGAKSPAVPATFGPNAFVFGHATSVPGFGLATSSAGAGLSTSSRFRGKPDNWQKRKKKKK